MTIDSAREGSGTYARLRSLFQNLRAAADGAHRSLQWCDSDQRLGVARDEHGRIEIFIAGPTLSPASRIIAVNLSHNLWHRVQGEAFTANRILLPPAVHYDSVAAFLCTELIDNGLLTDPAAALRRSEPVIEMAIQRLTMQAEAIVGLTGELLLMSALIDRAPDSHLRHVIDGWHGHQHSARDLQLAEIGIEVKTTRQPASVHRIHGTHQVTPGIGVSGVFESRLFLVSIGIEPGEASDPASSWSLPGIVDGLLERISQRIPDSAAEVSAHLIDRLRTYGGQPDGYDHHQMRDRVALAQPWRTAFARSYDMADPSITCLRTPDLAKFTTVPAASVEYTIELPVSVNGDLNPIVGLRPIAERLVKLAWPPR